MVRTSRGFTEVGRILWELRPSGEEASLRCHRMDVDGNGQQELCLQLGDQFLALRGAQLVRHAQKIVLSLQTPDSPQGIGDYCESDGSRVSRVTGGQTVWEHDLARRRFGLGLGRDDSDDLELDSRFFGSYRERVSVCLLEWIGAPGAEDGAILALLANGRMARICLDGTILKSTQLPKGRIQDALVLPAAGAGSGTDTFALTLRYRQLRKRFFWADMFESVAVLCRGDRVTDQRRNLTLVAPLPRPSGGWLDDGFQVVSVFRGGFSVENGGSRWRGRRTPGGENAHVVRNPWDPKRPLRLRLDGLTGRFTVQTLAGEDVWEQDLPPSESGNYGVCATLGPKGDVGAAFLALWLRTEHTLPDVMAQVSRDHLRVYRMDGTLVASWEDAPRGDRFGREPVPLLDGPDEEGRITLYLLESEGAVVYELDVSGQGSDAPRHPTHLPPCLRFLCLRRTSGSATCWQRRRIASRRRSSAMKPLDATSASDRGAATPSWALHERFLSGVREVFRLFQATGNELVSFVA